MGGLQIAGRHLKLEEGFLHVSGDSGPATTLIQGPQLRGLEGNRLLLH